MITCLSLKLYDYFFEFETLWFIIYDYAESQYGIVRYQLT